MFKSTHKKAGFTLLEVMITVAIIGILSAIAIPQYGDYTKKARRADAMAALSDVYIKEQQYLLTQRAYSTSVSDLGVVVSPSLTAFYGIAITVDTTVTPPTFVAAATPSGDQTADICGTLGITQDGTKTAVQSGGAVSGCW